MSSSTPVPPRRSGGSWAHRSEQGVYKLLTVLLAIYIAVEIIELMFQFGRALVLPDPAGTRLLVGSEPMRAVIPVFFNILIALELIETLRVYARENTIQVQSILLIGLMAIGRKLLVLDLGHADGLTTLGLAGLILALAVGYYLVGLPPRRAGPGPAGEA